jgi:hypothetical protein
VTSTEHHLPTSARLAAWRQAGRLICQCDEPRPVHLAIFGGDECRRCAKLIAGRVGEELLRRRNELEP